MEKVVQKNATLKWKAEVTFEGTVDEFNSFKAMLVKHPVAIAVADFGKFIDVTGSGYAQFDYRIAFKAGQLESMIEGAPRLDFKRIRGFAGGIRTPHLHLGDEVVLVDKERFKNILGEVARNIFEQRVDAADDFCEMIKPLVGA